jgi:hypothetical protein
MPPNKPSRRSRARLKKKERELALCLNCLLGYEEEGLYSSVVIDFIAPEVKDFSKTRVRAKTEGIYENNRRKKRQEHLSHRNKCLGMYHWWEMYKNNGSPGPD